MRGWTRLEWLWAQAAFTEWRNKKEETMNEEMYYEAEDELCDAIAHLRQGRRSVLALELEATYGVVFSSNDPADTWAERRGER
jgi:hypothetical protein